MKKLFAVTAVFVALALPIAVVAAEHGGHTGNHKSSAAHEEVVEGVKVVFNIQTMAEAMKEMGMQMPKGVKETHHITVTFKDVKNGKDLTEGDVAIKIQNPDKTTHTKDLVGMNGHFGGDFVFSKNGKYGVMSKFVLKDGKTRQAKFWYTVKGAQ